MSGAVERETLTEFGDVTFETFECRLCESDYVLEERAWAYVGADEVGRNDESIRLYGADIEQIPVCGHCLESTLEYDGTSEGDPRYTDTGNTRDKDVLVAATLLSMFVGGAVGALGGFML